MDELPLPWPEDREVWRPIPGWRGYEVSSSGQVRTWRSSGTGKGKLKTFARVLSPNKHKNGYRTVQLSDANSKQTRFYIHRLLLIAFAGAPVGSRRFSRHLNNERSCNSVNNLSWSTKSENESDKARFGTYPPAEVMCRGERCPVSKLTTESVITIRARVAAGETQASMATEFRVTQASVSALVRRKTWKHVS